MKLKHIIFGILLTGFIYSCNDAKKEQASKEGTDTLAVEKKYAMILDSSSVNWKGSVINIKSHFGSLKLTNGNLNVKGDQIIGGTFTADLKSINPLDSGYTKEHPKEGLVGHLQAPDFFAADSFPTATFVIKSIEGNVATGDLTVRGRTNEEKVTDVVISTVDNKVKATGKLVFDRQKYGVSYKSQMKDMVLSDDIELNIVLVGQQQ